MTILINWLRPLPQLLIENRAQELGLSCISDKHLNRGLCPLITFLTNTNSEIEILHGKSKIFQRKVIKYRQYKQSQNTKFLTLILLKFK